MADRIIGMDDLCSDIDDHLNETDAMFVAALAEKLMGGIYLPLSDGDTIRHDGIKESVNSVIQDILSAVGDLPLEAVVKLANEIFTDEFEAGTDGRIHVTFKPEGPTP